jgi:hypothetical protein
MNMREFGDKSRFAMVVGEIDPANPDMRVVEIWAGGQEITCDDSDAYLPTFCRRVDGAIVELLSDLDLSPPWPELSFEEVHRRLNAVDDGSREQYWVMLHWGETTDNISALTFRRHDRIIITFEFWRPTHRNPGDVGRVFVVEMAEKELLRVLYLTITHLRVN